MDPDIMNQSTDWGTRKTLLGLSRDGDGLAICRVSSARKPRLWRTLRGAHPPVPSRVLRRVEGRLVSVLLYFMLQIEPEPQNYYFIMYRVCNVIPGII